MSIRDRIFGNRKTLDQVGDAAENLGEIFKDFRGTLGGRAPNKITICEVCTTPNPTTNATCYKCGNVL